MRTHATLAALILVCGSASAQTALDKPQDKNLQVGAGGVRNAARPTVAQELNLRNAIVTGNAPGGFSFRGDVGYVAPGEFFGSLGSNDSFSFRRDSYYSGLAGVGIRGTDALQYQFAMTTGNTPPAGFSGAPIFSRSGTSATAQQIRTRQNTAVTGEAGITRPTVDITEPGADLRGLMSLRSPSAYLAARGLDPTVLSRVPNNEGGSTDISASSLRGITFDATPPSTREENERPRPGAVAPLSTRLEDPLADSKLKEKADTKSDTKADTKLDASPSAKKTPYDELMDRIKASKTDVTEKPATNLPAWQTQLEELRRQLGQTTRTRPTTPKQGEGAPKGDAGEPATPSDELRPETVDRIRGAGIKVEQLALPGYDPYSAHMQAAEEHIAAGRFFFAEERFTTALALKSGDPMAAVGRVHAQLGAGMFLSAAINLRSLFVEHPEVVALKYKAALLPTNERMTFLVERLSELAEAKDEKRRDSAFLAAYIAFQSGDDKAMRRNLTIMATPVEPAPGDKPAAGPDQLERLATLLSKVWLSPSPNQPAPAPSKTPEPSK